MTDESSWFEDPRPVLRRYGFSPKQSWGQNFLVSSRVVKRIAEVTADCPERRILEIGAGVGTLTRALIARNCHVTALERDRDMCAVLREEFAKEADFQLEETDAKKFDYRYFCKTPTVISGNLPYQITGPLLRRIMEVGTEIVHAVVMVQEAVADRIVANVGDASRGALSVMIKARFDTKIALRVSPTAFYPQPRVRSAVVVLRPGNDGLLGPHREPAQFDRVVKAAFSTRRKYLRNALVSGGAGTAEKVTEALERAEIDPQLRPENLQKEDFASIVDFLKNI